jgi:hypothetical protein
MGQGEFVRADSFFNSDPISRGSMDALREKFVSEEEFTLIKKVNTKKKALGKVYTAVLRKEEVTFCFNQIIGHLLNGSFES